MTPIVERAPAAAAERAACPWRRAADRRGAQGSLQCSRPARRRRRGQHVAQGLQRDRSSAPRQGTDQVPRASAAALRRRRSRPGATRHRDGAAQEAPATRSKSAAPARGPEHQRDLPGQHERPAPRAPVLRRGERSLGGSGVPTAQRHYHRAQRPVAAAAQLASSREGARAPEQPLAPPRSGETAAPSTSPCSRRTAASAALTCRCRDRGPAPFRGGRARAAGAGHASPAPRPSCGARRRPALRSPPPRGA